MLTMYGIKNCTTVQKARKWLEDHDIEYDFHDYKKLGIDREHLQTWCEEFGWEKVLNRAGMMWRKADPADKAKVVDQSSAIEFMIQVPTAIKRPIIELEKGNHLLGFEEGVYQNTLL